MSEIESDLSLKLKNILNKDFWTVKQYYPIENMDNYEIKILFENLPGVLIWDFFAPNIINQLTINEKSLSLVATGIDDVIWTYELIKVSID